jgi:hypothetical protein
MRSLLHDILNDPGEYLPALSILAVLFLIRAGSCLSAFLSIRSEKPRRRFWFALPPLAFGLMGVLSQVPFSVKSDTFELKLDFRWCFVIPLLLGVVGLVRWWRARQVA